MPVDDDLAEQPFRMPVQWVNRPDLDFRGFSGRIVGGTIRPGDQIRVLPSGTTSTVERIVTMDGDLDEAIAGQSVTLTLTDEIDASRGDVICGRDDPAEVADQFEAHVVWMHEDEMLPGPAVPDEDRCPHGRSDDRASRSIGSTSTASISSPRRRSS